MRASQFQPTTLTVCSCLDYEALQSHRECCQRQWQTARGAQSPAQSRRGALSQTFAGQSTTPCHHQPAQHPPLQTAATATAPHAQSHQRARPVCNMYWRMSVVYTMWPMAMTAQTAYQLWDQQVERSYSDTILVLTHVEGLARLGIVVHHHRSAAKRLTQPPACPCIQQLGLVATRG